MRKAGTLIFFHFFCYRFVVLLPFFFILPLLVSLEARSNTIDSIKRIVATTKNDSIKIEALKAWDNLIYTSNRELDRQLNSKILVIASKHLENDTKQNYFRKAYADANNVLAITHQRDNEYEKADNYYSIALKHYKQLGDRKNQIKVLSNTGLMYFDQNNTSRAIETFYRCLALKEKDPEDEILASLCISIGVVFKESKDYKKALEFYQRSLGIYQRLKDEKGMSTAYNNIAVVHYRQKKYRIALAVHNKAKAIRLRLNDTVGMASTYNNIGRIYEALGQYDSALMQYSEEIKIERYLENRKGISTALISIGGIELLKEQYNDAIKLSTEGLKIGQEIGEIQNCADAAGTLYLAYLKTGYKRKAYEMLTLKTRMQDSSDAINNSRSILQQQFKYDYEKKLAADQIKNENEKKIADQFYREEQTKRYGLMVGLILTLVFGLFMFNRFRIARKQKHIIELQKAEVEKQKSLIEEKQKEIIDSIYYAQKIQNALLPAGKYLEKNMKRKSNS